MAEEVEMTPVEAAEPPKANPLSRPASPVSAPAAPVVHKPVAGATAGLKPGLKLPTQNALRPGLKLPPKAPAAPGASSAGGLKLPTQNALKPGVRLPPKPVIRKPGSTVVAAPLPRPISAVKPAAADAKSAETPPKDAAKAVGRVVPAAAPAAAAAPEAPKPLEALKSVTQKLKGITQEIPQQAILRKTGIIADGAMSAAQKEAAKHKTARISLSDAMGVAPVKNENAPIKTIRIKRPVDIPGGTKPLAPQPHAGQHAPAAAEAPAGQAAETVEPTATQRKTLKITRPGGGAVRPAGKFGIKRPGAAPAAASSEPVADMPADIPDISEMPVSATAASTRADNGPAWLWTLSALVQLAACAVAGALAWFLYSNTATSYF